MNHFIHFAFLCLLLIGGVPNALKGQKTYTLDSTVVAKYTSYFDLADGLPEGKGIEVLKSAFEASQFVMLGEYHDSPEINLLASRLLPVLQAARYKYCALEVGPQSIHKLQALAHHHEETQQALFDFNTRYYNKHIDDTPIPFFDKKENAQFLAEAGRLGLELWGVDQEYYYSLIFLLDELYAMVDDSAKKGAIELAYKKAHKSAAKHFQKDGHKDDYSLLTELLADEAIEAFFQTFPKTNTPAWDIIQALRKSWEIYAFNENGRNDYYGNNGTRARHMRENFVKRYKAAQAKGDSLPKVFVKIGGYHAAKGVSPLQIYELGNMLHELAAFNGSQSVHILCHNRYYLDEGEVKDNAQGKAEWTKLMYPFISQGKTDQWTLIDLRPMARLVANRRQSAPKVLAYKLGHYDFILIPPIDGTTSLNYQQAEN